MACRGATLYVLVVRRVVAPTCHRQSLPGRGEGRGHNSRGHAVVLQLLLLPLAQSVGDLPAACCCRRWARIHLRTQRPAQLQENHPGAPQGNKE